MDIIQLKEALKNKPFAMVDVNQLLPASQKFKSYTVELKTIEEATGGNGSGTVVIQSDFVVLASKISLFGVKNSKTYAIIESDQERDIFSIDVSSSNAKIFQKPQDVFSYNEFFAQNQLNRIGVYFSDKTQLDIVLTRTQNVGSANGANVISKVSFVGFEL